MQAPIHVTKTTFRVADFLAWQRHNALNLRPPFQRDSVWSTKAKSLFIDTLISGYPVPLIFLKDDTDERSFEPLRLVVDGQQRLRTAISFIDPSALKDRKDSDNFTIQKTHNPDKSIYGRSFADLPKEARSQILDYEFSVAILQPGTPNSLLLDMFARLNSTGVKLTAQEIRNAEFNGEFKTLAYRLSHEQYDNWSRWGVFTSSAFARMKDVEVTSDIMILLEKGVQAKSQSAIRNHYEKNEDDFPLGERIEKRFRHVAGCINDIDRKLEGGLKNTRFSNQSWFYALFHYIEKQLFPNQLPNGSDTPKKVNTSRIATHLTKCDEQIESGNIPEKLRSALRGAAADKASRETLFGFLSKD